MFDKISGFIVKSLIVLIMLAGGLFIWMMDSANMALSGKHSWEYWGK